MISRLLLVCLLASVCFAGPERNSADGVAPAYYWHSSAISKTPDGTPTAQLLTLFCAGCGKGDLAGRDIPVIAILRDTLGDQDPENDKLTAVWLLSYSRSTLGQKMAASLPFFYWKLGDGSQETGARDTSPLLDLATPQNPAVVNVGRQLLQWTTLDTLDAPVRATSRAYRTNQVDDERLHLEEANSYLLHAPTSDDADSLTKQQLDFVIARLELRKNLLGGFVSANKAASLAEYARFTQEEVRSRNWEILRQSAEKTGLLFEPLNIGQSNGEYAMMWYPAKGSGEPAGGDLNSIWKVLNLKNPYSDERLANWTGITETRWLDADGALLPPGQSGAKQITLIPLGVYSLNYPRVPLLLIDFRNERRLQHHELLQKGINELTAGVIGISRFANWYYFVGADIYNFYQGRHGEATSRAERLDCYSQFRVALHSDRQLDGDLRQEMQRRGALLSVNPLESSEKNEMKAAVSRYASLEAQTRGNDSRLWKRLDQERRKELASFGVTPGRQVLNVTLHTLTFGEYQKGKQAGQRDIAQREIAMLDSYRRVQYQLAFLDGLVVAGTAPEVTYQPARLVTAVQQLTGLMPRITSPSVRQHAQTTLDRLGKLSLDQALRADCERAVASVSTRPTDVPGVLASPAALENPR